MGFFNKKPKVEPCPACTGIASQGHCTDEHTVKVDGGYVFLCSCGVSTMQWPSQDTAGMCMAIHMDHDHGTHISPLDSTGVRMIYRQTFPEGATRPLQS